MNGDMRHKDLSGLEDTKTVKLGHRAVGALNAQSQCRFHLIVTLSHPVSGVESYLRMSVVVVVEAAE